MTYERSFFKEEYLAENKLFITCGGTVPGVLRAAKASSEVLALPLALPRALPVGCTGVSPMIRCNYLVYWLSSNY